MASGPRGWSPLRAAEPGALSSSSRGEEDEDTRYLEREIDMLERAVGERGVVSRRARPVQGAAAAAAPAGVLGVGVSRRY
jgi:hypothetical protein